MIKCLKLSHQNSSLMKLLEGEKKKKLFITVLDRKMPARDKGGTKKSVRLIKMMLKMQYEVH